MKNAKAFKPIPLPKTITVMREDLTDLENCRNIMHEALDALQFAEPYIAEWADRFDPDDDADEDVRKARQECIDGLENIRRLVQIRVIPKKRRARE